MASPKIGKQGEGRKVKQMSVEQLLKLTENKDKRSAKAKQELTRRGVSH